MNVLEVSACMSKTFKAKCTDPLVWTFLVDDLTLRLRVNTNDHGYVSRVRLSKRVKVATRTRVVFISEEIAETLPTSTKQLKLWIVEKVLELQ